MEFGGRSGFFDLFFITLYLFQEYGVDPFHLRFLPLFGAPVIAFDCRRVPSPALRRRLSRQYCECPFSAPLIGSEPLDAIDQCPRTLPMKLNRPAAPPGLQPIGGSALYIGRSISPPQRHD
jgi:hypothetical protein